MSSLRNNICNYIPVLTNDIFSPIIVTDHNFAILCIATRSYKSAAVTGCLVVPTSGLCKVVEHWYIIKCKFLQGIVCRQIKTVIILVFCVQALNYAVDFLFVLWIQFIP